MHRSDKTQQSCNTRNIKKLHQGTEKSDQVKRKKKKKLLKEAMGRKMLYTEEQRKR
jgi:hypothetical protein